MIKRTTYIVSINMPL